MMPGVSRINSVMTSPWKLAQVAFHVHCSRWSISMHNIKMSCIPCFSKPLLDVEQIYESKGLIEKNVLYLCLFIPPSQSNRSRGGFNYSYKIYTPSCWRIDWLDSEKIYFIHKLAGVKYDWRRIWHPIRQYHQAGNICHHNHGIQMLGVLCSFHNRIFKPREITTWL